MLYLKYADIVDEYDNTIHRIKYKELGQAVTELIIICDLKDSRQNLRKRNTLKNYFRKLDKEFQEYFKL